jgi:hypothetical protein
MLLSLTFAALASAAVGSAMQQRRREEVAVKSFAGRCAVSVRSLLPSFVDWSWTDLDAFQRVEAAIIREPHGADLRALVCWPYLTHLAVRDLDDEAASSLAAIQSLRTLAASRDGLTAADGASGRLTDRGAAYIGELGGLERLSLFNSDIGDEGARSLGRLVNLRELMLPGSKISDAGIDAIASMPRLERLDLSGCKVTNVGLCRLAQCRSLRSLGLRQTGVGDAGLICLADSPIAPCLTELDLTLTMVTDDGVAALKACRRLETLRLVETVITDNSLETFQALPRLFWIDVDGCDELSAGGRRELESLRDARDALVNPAGEKQRITAEPVTARQAVESFFPRRIWEDR